MSKTPDDVSPVVAKRIQESDALEKAVKNDDLAAVVALLSKEVDPNGWMMGLPLRNACARNNLAIVKALITAGADPSAENGAAMLGAIEHGYLNILEYLLEHGGNPNVSNGRVVYTTILYGNDKRDALNILLNYTINFAPIKNNVIRIIKQYGYGEIKDLLIRRGGFIVADF